MMKQLQNQSLWQLLQIKIFNYENKNLKYFADPIEGVKKSNCIMTDVWVSMGEPEEVWKERISLLQDYQVNTKVMELTGNPNIKFLHLRGDK